VCIDQSRQHETAAEGLNVRGWADPMLRVRCRADKSNLAVFDRERACDGMGRIHGVDLAVRQYDVPPGPPTVSASDRPPARLPPPEQRACALPWPVAINTRAIVGYRLSLRSYRPSRSLYVRARELINIARAGRGLWLRGRVQPRCGRRVPRPMACGEAVKLLRP